MRLARKAPTRTGCQLPNECKARTKASPCIDRSKTNKMYLKTTQDDRKSHNISAASIHSEPFASVVLQLWHNK